MAERMKILGLIIVFSLLVTISGCVDGGPSTPSGCGDGFCGVGETVENCPVDCSGSGTTRPSQPSRPTGGGRYDAPELDLEIDDTGIPETMTYEEDAFIIARVRNEAEQSMSEEENERRTIRNVEVLFYNFGDFFGCTPSTFTFSTLLPEEEREAVCTVTPPSKEVEQTINVRSYYTYDLYATLDGIQVMSEDEFERQGRPQGDVVDTSVSGPLSITMSASKVPVQSDRPVTVAIELEADMSKEGGVVKKGRTGNEYHVQLLQVQIPEDFTIRSAGQFSRTGNTLTISKVRLSQDGTKEFRIYLNSPDLDVPLETYSINAVATGFSVFTMDSVDLEVRPLS